MPSNLSRQTTAITTWSSPRASVTLSPTT
jgi:hypothetical protein